MTVNFLKLRKDINTQIQGELQTPSRINKEKSTCRHVKIEMQKIKDTSYCLFISQVGPQFPCIYTSVYTPLFSSVQMSPIIYQALSDNPPVLTFNQIYN